MDRTVFGRRRFLQRTLTLAAGAALSPAAAVAMRLHAPDNGTQSGTSATNGAGPNVTSQESKENRTRGAGRMPVVFIGHGSPMNAIEDNTWSRSFRQLAGELPRPKAVVAVSAHWYGDGTKVTGQAQPPTIHDFGGFPQELYEQQYPAPGSEDLAARIVQLVGSDRAQVSHEWGLDHGTWSVLVHLLPEADVPVVQLSIDADLTTPAHLEIGKALAPLREEGVLILGSGNITHNLGYAFRSAGRGDLSLPEWAGSFDADVAKALEQHDGRFLAEVLSSEHGRQCHPTPDHYLPLLYVAGAVDTNDRTAFPITGFDFGSLSMRAVVFADA